MAIANVVSTKVGKAWKANGRLGGCFTWKPSGLELDAAARKIASPAVFVVHYADVRPLDIARPTHVGIWP